MLKKIWKDENGAIVVETVGSFMLFTFFTLSIITLISIVTVQARVHYAITQTATELSMYSYVLDAVGLSGHIKGAADASDTVQGQIDEVTNNITSIRSGASSAASGDNVLENLNIVIESIGNLGSVASGALQDPQETFYNVIMYGIDGAKNYVMQEYVIEPMVMKYLATGDVGADIFLGRGNVVGYSGSYGGVQFNPEVHTSATYLDFSDSEFIDANGDITIVVEYKINYAAILGALPLPEAMRTLTIRQTAKTAAWLGGVEWNP